MGRRITRKQLKQQDDFVTIADSVFTWFNENWRPIVLVAGTVAVLYTIWGLANTWSDTRAIDASSTLTKAVAVLDGEVEESPGEESPEPVTPQDPEEALAGVVDQHGRTIQGDIARLYLARMALEKGETDEARAELVRLADRQRGNTVGRLATYDLVRLRLASGQGDEVAAELQAMVTGEDNRLPRELALWELASLYEDRESTKEAKEYFQKLADEFPDSSFGRQASRKLTELS